MHTPSSTDRCTAALIASAVGDALGAPTEFMSRHAIDDLVGARGVRTFLEPTPGITDDTVSRSVSHPVSRSM